MLVQVTIAVLKVLAMLRFPNLICILLVFEVAHASAPSVLTTDPYLDSSVHFLCGFSLSPCMLLLGSC